MYYERGFVRTNSILEYRLINTWNLITWNYASQEKLRKRVIRNISISRGSKQRANRKLRNADRRLILRQKTKRFERISSENVEYRARFQSCHLCFTESTLYSVSFKVTRYWYIDDLFFFSYHREKISTKLRSKVLIIIWRWIPLEYHIVVLDIYFFTFLKCPRLFHSLILTRKQNVVRSLWICILVVFHEIKFASVVEKEKEREGRNTCSLADYFNLWD